MKLVINIRGANGSGKTAIIREVLKHKANDCPPHEYTPTRTSKRAGKITNWPIARCVDKRLSNPIYVQGRYDVATGGCDREEDMDAIEANIAWATKNLNGHILFEGMCVSKSGTRWLANAQNLDPQVGFLWLFLQPPPEALFSRILRRNGGKEFNRKSVESTSRTVENIRQKVLAVLPNWVFNLDWVLPPRLIYEQFVQIVGECEGRELT